MALGAVSPVSLFLLQQRLYAAFDSTLSPPCPVGGGILDPVAAVVIPLPTLGGISELAPQASRSIVQPTADKLLRRGFDLLLQAFLFLTLFLDFFDVLSPPGTGNRAANAALFPIFSRCFLL
jgi:hypothetical protein